MTETIPFWLVWREGGRAPTKKHSSVELAELEAERLAREMPGEAFYVLAPMLRVRRVDVERQRFAVTDDMIPF